MNVLVLLNPRSGGADRHIYADEVTPSSGAGLSGPRRETTITY